MAANRTSAAPTRIPRVNGAELRGGKTALWPPGEPSTPPAGRQEPTEPWSNYPEIQGGENAGKRVLGWGGGRKKKKSKIHEDSEKSDGGNGIGAI